MANPYFRNLPEFEYVNRTKEGRSEGDYSIVKNCFKRGKLREDIFQDVTFFTKYMTKFIGFNSCKSSKIPFVNSQRVLSTKFTHAAMINHKVTSFCIQRPFIDRERAISFTESKFFHSYLTLMTSF